MLTVRIFILTLIMLTVGVIKLTVSTIILMGVIIKLIVIINNSENPRLRLFETKTDTQQYVDYLINLLENEPSPPLTTVTCQRTPFLFCMLLFVVLLLCNTGRSFFTACVFFV